MNLDHSTELVGVSRNVLEDVTAESLDSSTTRALRTHAETRRAHIAAPFEAELEMVGE